MSDLEYLFEYAKQCQEKKDAADILDIVQNIKKLDYFYQQGNQTAIIQLVQKVVKDHQAEADEHDKGQPPAQDVPQLYHSCRAFLIGLGMDKLKKKAAEKVAEEALKQLDGN